MDNPVEKVFEDVAKINQLSIPIDPYDSPEYQAFVDSMVPFCHCARNRPCDGVLAGGMCDDIQDDEGNDIGDWDNEEGDK